MFQHKMNSHSNLHSNADDRIKNEYLRILFVIFNCVCKHRTCFPLLAHSVVSLSQDYTQDAVQLIGNEREQQQQTTRLLLF